MATAHEGTGTGVGDHIHVIGIRLVEHALGATGAKVVSLGVMTPVVEFVEARGI